MQESPLFLGLTRPPKFFGLPVGYFIGLALGTVIPFVGLDDVRFLAIGVIAYPPLWLIADRNPHLFEVIAGVLSTTPRTKNFKLNGGNRYVS